MSNPDPAAERAEIERLRRDGRFVQALSRQRQVLSAHPPEPRDYWRLGLLCFVTAAWADAVEAFQHYLTLDPQNDRARENLAMSLLRMGRAAEAIGHLDALHAADPARLNILDGLADGHGQLGNTDAARKAGERALALRDATVMANHQARGTAAVLSPVPPFRGDRPDENIIAFSLFGDGARYREGVLQNARAIPFVYPSWRARIYAGPDQPAALLDALRDLGAQVQVMPAPERFADGLFWRFRALQDPAVRRFLVRDADSVVSVRERVAVDAWLAAGTHFHVMRDHAAQTDLILAGLWGGVANALPPLAKLLDGYTYAPSTESRTADQKFLRERVWPLIKPSVTIHDSLYRSFGALPFPALGTLPPGRHLGDIPPPAR
ncbi:MAG: tetratricopeptide repeat protein [Pseudomonadota bacterium]